MRKYTRDRRGFTLIEVILVIVLTAIALPTLIMVLGTQARYTVETEKITISAEVGQELMEEVFGAGYSAAKSFDGFADSVTLSGVTYSRGVGVCNVAGADPDACDAVDEGFVKVTVTVTSDAGSVSIDSLLSDF